ncbi:hypothetical protein AMTRI_Chr04g183490 [Amborella trichopoda]
MCHMTLIHEERESKHEREEAPLDHHTPPALSNALNRPRFQRTSIHPRSLVHSSIRALSSARILSCLTTHSTVCALKARPSTHTHHRVHPFTLSTAHLSDCTQQRTHPPKLKSALQYL